MIKSDHLEMPHFSQCPFRYQSECVIEILGKPCAPKCICKASMQICKYEEEQCGEATPHDLYRRGATFIPVVVAAHCCELLKWGCNEGYHDQYVRQ